MLKNDNTINIGHKAVITAAQITEAKDYIKEAQSDLKEVIKTAVKREINMPALEWVMKVQKSGKFREADEFLRDAILYRKAFGSGVSRDQIDFYNLLDVELPLDERAYSDGFVAGAFNKDQSSNPHDLSMIAGQRWMNGWSDGYAKRNEIEKEEENFQFEHIPSSDDAGDTSEDEAPE